MLEGDILSCSFEPSGGVQAAPLRRECLNNRKGVVVARTRSGDPVLNDGGGFADFIFGEGGDKAAEVIVGLAGLVAFDGFLEESAALRGGELAGLVGGEGGAWSRGRSGGLDGGIGVQGPGL